MRKQITIWQMVLVMLLVSASFVLAERAIVTAGGDGVTTAGNQVSITVSLPEAAVGGRIDRATLEVPLTMEQGVDSLFNDFPLVEITEVGSELPKQTTLLEKGFDGIARFDVTRFVRGWSNTDEHEFVLGALSESNGTSLDLGAAQGWEGSAKARLVVTFSANTGASGVGAGVR